MVKGARASAANEPAEREEGHRVDVVERALDDDEARAEEKRDEDERGCGEQLSAPTHGQPR